VDLSAPAGHLEQALAALAVAPAELRALPAGERVLLSAGLTVLHRLDQVVTGLHGVVAEQQAAARRARELLDLFPPLFTRLKELLDAEIESVRRR